MDLKDNCKLLLDKATQKVKCCKFHSKDLNRELAVHEDISDKNKTSVTDIVTGCRLFVISTKVKDVKESDIKDNMQKFISHYTLDSIKAKFEELDKIPMEQRFKGNRK